MWEEIGFWAGVVLPLFDIPLIVRIIKRRSSSDISTVWIVGLWATSVLMMVGTKERMAMGFNIVNVLMLTIVMGVVFKYRKQE